VPVDLNRWWAKTQLGANVRLRIYRKMSKMLSNGLPLLKVLEELEQRASDGGRKPGEPLAIVLSEWRLSVQGGRMLSQGMEGWVPHGEQMIIMAGEQSGRIEESLLAVASVVLSARKIRAAIVGGLAYPLVVLSMVLMYVYLFGTRVIPQFAQVANPEHWQGAARSLYLMSQFVQGWMWLLLLSLLLGLILVVWSMPRWNGSLRILVDRFPPYSTYRLMVGSGFLIAMSALQSSGMTIEKSLTRLAGAAAPWLQVRLEGALLGVRSGLNAGEALRNTGYQFPSREIIEDLCIYAEYKGFSDALRMLADEWMEEGVEKISAQMRMLNSIAIASLALVVGWLVTGFFGIQQEIAALTRRMH
jgi:type II secretory pathway component PulF